MSWGQIAAFSHTAQWNAVSRPHTMQTPVSFKRTGGRGSDSRTDPILFEPVRGRRGLIRSQCREPEMALGCQHLNSSDIPLASL